MGDIPRVLIEFTQPGGGKYRAVLTCEDTYGPGIHTVLWEKDDCNCMGEPQWAFLGDPDNERDAVHILWSLFQRIASGEIEIHSSKKGLT